MNFYMEQLQNESKYIEDKYFSSLIRNNIKDVRIEDDFVVKRVSLNEIPYKMYIKKSKDFEILFIPEINDNNINFINDFNSIIKYKKTNNEIHFSLISKKDNCINLVNYDFSANDSGYSIGNYFYDSFIDNNYILQFESLKSNTSVVDFLYNINTRKLTDCGYRLDRIKRNKNETKLNRINEISLLEAYEVYDTRFFQIDDNETPILELFEKMYDKDNIKTRI